MNTLPVFTSEIPMLPDSVHCLLRGKSRRSPLDSVLPIGAQFITTTLTSDLMLNGAL